jgi:hypothetical protein
MAFRALTSLTGGGGLQSASDVRSRAGDLGGSKFDLSFNPTVATGNARASSQPSDIGAAVQQPNNLLIMAVVAVTALLVLRN